MTSARRPSYAFHQRLTSSWGTGNVLCQWLEPGRARDWWRSREQRPVMMSIAAPDGNAQAREKAQAHETCRHRGGTPPTSFLTSAHTPVSSACITIWRHD